jgi:hypothetical protein
MTDRFTRVAVLVAAVAVLGLGPAGFRNHGHRMGQETIRASVSTDPSEVAAGGAMTFTLRVENGSPDTVTFEFMTSQRYEFLVTSATQDTVWRWGEGRGSMQVLGQERLAPGQVLTYREALDARLVPGRYTVTGVLAARNRPLQATAEFTVVEGR